MEQLSGDPGSLITAANDQLAVAEAISEAVTRLRAIAHGDLATSDAVDALAKKSSDVATVIQKAHVRLTGTSNAVIEYAHSLSDAQAKAARAITAAQNASDSKAHASAKHDDYQRQADASSSDPDLITQALHFAQQAKEYAEHEAAALLLYGQAVAEKETAALIAVSKIKSAADDSGLNDGFFDYLAKGWDDFMQWVRDNADTLAFIEDILDQVSQWAGFLSTVLGLLALLPIPGLDAVLAVASTILRVVSIVAGAAALLITLALVLSGSNKKSVGDLVSQGLGFAVQFIPIPGAKGAGEAVTRSVANQVGRAAARKSGELVTQSIEIVVGHGVDQAVGAIGATVDAVHNVNDPSNATTCPARPPLPIKIDGLPEPDDYGVYSPPSLLPPTVGINPDFISSIGCKASS